MFLQDIRYGVRVLRRTPGFTLIAVITVALGIGANTAIFSFADALLFRPLAVREPGRLAVLYHVGIESSGNYSSFSFPDYIELRDRNHSFSGLAAYSTIPLDLGDAGRVERVNGQIVSGNYFSVLGVEPALGRAFFPEEDQTPGSSQAAVISYRLWQRRFGSDSNLPGKTVTLDGHRFTVIGVAPKSFRGVLRSRMKP